MTNKEICDKIEKATEIYNIFLSIVSSYLEKYLGEEFQFVNFNSIIFIIYNLEEKILIEWEDERSGSRNLTWVSSEELLKGQNLSYLIKLLEIIKIGE